MCGRYSFFKKERLVERFHVPQEEVLPLFDRFNVAPTLRMPVIVRDGGGNHVRLMRWGLIPHWAKDKAIGSRMINARVETLAEKPSFKRPLQRQRCLIPARGFFEWKKEGTRKVPYFIHRPDSDFFAFAGLYDTWHDADAGEDVLSYTIITTDARGPVKAVHHRMPIILPENMEQAWVDPSLTDPRELVDLLQAIPDLELYPVSTLVNSPGNDTGKVLERVG